MKIIKKMKWVIFGGVFLFGIGFIGHSVAYLSDGDSAVNEITVGGNRVEIVEEFEPPAELVPGVSFTKDVKVENVGPSDCYVRIKAVFTDSDMGKYCSVDFNTTDYTYNEADGYYYYKKILKSGDATPSLFTTVTLSNAITTAEIKDFDILVYTESYQSAGFTDYSKAWEHYHKNKPD